MQPFLDITTNPSWEIARQLPASLTTPNGETITIIVPPDPLPAAYHKILTQIPALIAQHAPDFVIHIGLDVGSGLGVFKIERSAPREGYHDIPDIDRKVFTRRENKKLFGRAASSLQTGLHIDEAAEVWREKCSTLRLPLPQASIRNGSNLRSTGKSKGTVGVGVDVQLSDDVGTYVCGFNYYVGSLEMQKQSARKEVVFLHVPRLQNDEEVQIGARVVQELIGALVSVWKQ